MAQPIWITPPGALEAPIPEGVFFSKPLEAYDPDAQPVYFQLIAGELPAGIQIQQSGLLVGLPKSIINAQGIPLDVSGDVTSKFAIRAYTKTTINGKTVVNRLADRTFELTVTGQNTPQFITPPGELGQYFDGTQIESLQIQYTKPDTDVDVTVKLVSGSLPAGLTISSTGVISGVIQPVVSVDATPGFSRANQGFSVYPFDFTTRSSNTNSEFVLEISDGRVGGSELRTFSIFVWSRALMSADTTTITADNTFITADVAPGWVPVLLNPQGSIGQYRNDNWFAYKFDAIDFDNDIPQYVISSSSPTPLTTIGLTLDINTGWLYGYLPNLGITDITYTFDVRVYKQSDPSYISDPYTYGVEIIGPIDSEITWLTDSNLGTITNGSTSTLFVEAVNRGGLELQYRLLSGSASELPQGLQLLPSGEIAGQVSFDTFALDSGTTTFDVSRENGSKPTTFDMVFTFTVTAYSVNGVIGVNKTFTITLIREFNEPYENLYIKAMPPENDRALLNSLLLNSDIFKPSLIYRPQDTNFGVARNVVYWHAYGLTASTIDDYYSALYENHYLKNLVLGSIKTAQARDGNGNVIYEVVYSQVVDNLVNNAGVSVNKQVNLAFPITHNNTTDISVVYPNSLVDMRTQVIDTVGQVSNVLPLWMTTKQSNGQVLGFTPAWVIAYVNPGEADRIAYYIQQQFGDRLNLIDFEVDRYELDRSLTKNWDPVTKQWTPNPPELTTFDVEAHYQLPVPNDSSFVFVGGIGYDIGDQILILGSQIGGEDGINDVTVTVQAVDENGTIEQAWATGFAVLNTIGNTYINIVGTNITGTGTGASWDLEVVGQDSTTFDGNSLEFTAPADMYTDAGEYDKYLVFPKRTILG